MKRVLFTLAVLVALVPGSQDAHAEAKSMTTVPLELAFVTPSRICGYKPGDSVRKLVCFPDAPPFADSIEPATDIVMSEAATCALEAQSGDWKCWGGKTSYTKDIVSAVIKTKRQSLFVAGDNLCAISESRNGKTVTCSVLNNYGYDASGTIYTRSNELKQFFGPFKNLKSVSGSKEFLCAIDGDDVVCFAQKANALPVLPTFKNPRLVAVTETSVCVVDDNGFRCYLRDASRRMRSRPYWKDAVSLKAGREGVCALLPNGKLECETKFPTSDDPLANVPRDLAKITDFDIGHSHICALSESKELRCWGPVFPSVSTVPAQIAKAKIKKVSTSTVDTCVLLENGMTECWGHNTNDTSNGPLPVGSSTNFAIGQDVSCRWNVSTARCESDGPLLRAIPDMHQIVSISVPAEGGTAVCAIEKTQSGKKKVRCWGSAGSISDVPTELIDPTHLAVFGNYACASTSDQIICWGRAGATAVYPDRVQNVKKIVVGENHACVIDDFGLACWGYNMTPELAVSADLARTGEALDVAVGRAHSCALTREKKVVCWGDNGMGQLDIPELKDPFSVGAFGNTSCASDVSGVICWGANLAPSVRAVAPGWRPHDMPFDGGFDR